MVSGVGEDLGVPLLKSPLEKDRPLCRLLLKRMQIFSGRMFTEQLRPSVNGSDPGADIRQDLPIVALVPPPYGHVVRGFGQLSFLESSISFERFYSEKV